VGDLITDLRAATVHRNLRRVREAIADAGRDPAEVEILAAVKYLPAESLTALHAGGIRVVGENRQQALAVKQATVADLFTWDFIGALQSRKVRDLVGRVRYIHSVASDSVLVQLGRHASPQTEVLVEVNVAGEAGKGGVAPAELDDFLARCPVTVVGLMTMPPRAPDPRTAAVGSPPSLPWPPNAASPSCRWGPARITRSRPPRGRRSSAWARSSTAARHNPVQGLRSNGRTSTIAYGLS
jgi:uncharacterized pyridoxal phosphate-containing UPF0001 family protein